VKTAQSAVGKRRVDPLDCLVERAEARALLWAQGLIETIPAAVDVLQHDAERDGLIKRIGQDAVQTILAYALWPYHEASNADLFEPIADERDEKPKHNALAASTIEAFKFVIRQNDPERLRAWLARHSPEECIALNKMLAAT
jgi:hypothetical protein